MIKTISKEMVKCPFEDVEVKDKVKLEESMGSFGSQMEEADKIANEFMELMRFGDSTTEGKVVIDGDEMNVILKIIYSNSLTMKTYADIVPMGRYSNGQMELTTLEITLYLNQFDRMSLDKDKLKGKITTLVAHELMHGNIYSKRIENGQGIGLSDLYDEIQEILRTENNRAVLDFAYAMYACDSQERAAIVSTTYSQMLELYDKGRLTALTDIIGKMTQEERYNYLLKLWKEDIKRTKAYKTYYYIRNMCDNMNVDNETKIEDIILTKYGIDIDVDKMIGKLRTIADGALKDVTRNGSLFFYNYMLELGRNNG